MGNHNTDDLETFGNEMFSSDLRIFHLWWWSRFQSKNCCLKSIDPQARPSVSLACKRLRFKVVYKNNMSKFSHLRRSKKHVFSEQPRKFSKKTSIFGTNQPSNLKKTLIFGTLFLTPLSPSSIDLPLMVPMCTLLFAISSKPRQ